MLKNLEIHRSIEILPSWRSDPSPPACGFFISTIKSLEKELNKYQNESMKWSNNCYMYVCIINYIKLIYNIKKLFLTLY
jgi:hypothetical protein